MLRHLVVVLLSTLGPAGWATFGAWSTIQIDKDAKPLDRDLEIKVLTVATFEIGQMSGDVPGEAQAWYEREKYSAKYYIPGGFSPLYCTDSGNCLIVSGMSTANSAASLMALGLHPHVKLRKTYILEAGIAGGDPLKVTLGSAAWSAWVVGSDDRHHIDRSELPKSWKFTDFRLGCSEPWCDKGWSSGNEVFRLNDLLTARAESLSRPVPLQDSPAAVAYRKHFPAGIPARAPPSVTQCDVLSGGEYYNGRIMSEWARFWVSHWTHQKGHYCATAMDDAGLMAAVARLASAHLVDPDRVMVLRTISDFDQPYPGQATLDSMKNTTVGISIALENAYRVGSTVLHHILDHWSEWENGVPKS
jgi:purine nucleoside permease